MRKSKGERAVKKQLKKLKVEFIEEKSFDTCRSNKNRMLRFDFYLTTLNVLIEFDGIQHFKPLSRRNKVRALKLFDGVVERDTIKDEWALANGIRLYRIPYNKLEEVPEIVTNIVKENLL